MDMGCEQFNQRLISPLVSLYLKDFLETQRDESTVGLLNKIRQTFEKGLTHDLCNRDASFSFLSL